MKICHFFLLSDVVISDHRCINYTTEYSNNMQKYVTSGTLKHLRNLLAFLKKSHFYNGLFFWLQTVYIVNVMAVALYFVVIIFVENFQLQTAGCSGSLSRDATWADVVGRQTVSLFCACCMQVDELAHDVVWSVTANWDVEFTQCAPQSVKHVEWFTGHKCVTSCTDAVIIVPASACRQIPATACR